VRSLSNRFPHCHFSPFNQVENGSKGSDIDYAKIEGQKEKLEFSAVLFHDPGKESGQVKDNLANK